MKTILILLATLFPFLHATRYEVKIESCKENEIIASSEESKLNLTLFNTKITDKNGWIMTCSLVNDAKHLTMEIDPSSKVSNNVAVYLFADDILVQEELIKKGYAYPMIRNPEYTYEKQLEKAYDATQTVAKPMDKVEEKKYPVQGPLLLGTFALLWLIMLAKLLYYKKKKQVLQSDETVLK